MSQVDSTFTAYFITSTAPGTPITGLSATITIVEAATGTVAINNAAMTEVGLGWYKYTFSAMDSNKDYLYSCNPNSASAFIESGVTDKRINNLDRELTSIVGGGRGMSVNMTGVTSSINRMSKELTTKIEEDIAKLSDLIKLVNNENYSHIDIVKTDIIDKIDSIEIPETIIEEKEAKKANKLLATIDKKLTSYIDSEMEDKSEIKAITLESIKQDMEDKVKHEKHMEEMKRKEEEDKKKEEEEDNIFLEEIKKYDAKQDEIEKEEKRKELEQELEELEREKKEKEKELNSL